MPHIASRPDTVIVSAGTEGHRSTEAEKTIDPRIITNANDEVTRLV